MNATFHPATFTFTLYDYHSVGLFGRKFKPIIINESLSIFLMKHFGNNVEQAVNFITDNAQLFEKLEINDHIDNHQCLSEQLHQADYLTFDHEGEAFRFRHYCIGCRRCSINSTFYKVINELMRAPIDIRSEILTFEPRVTEEVVVIGLMRFEFRTVSDCTGNNRTTITIIGLSCIYKVIHPFVAEFLVQRCVNNTAIAEHLVFNGLCDIVGVDSDGEIVVNGLLIPAGLARESDNLGYNIRLLLAIS